ncbi:hypothetical protein DOY81_005958 [Sarcophaga bullata]|nr:hypothetical protein DOY81_005958 [Sarcophaga bullata]
MWSQLGSYNFRNFMLMITIFILNSKLISSKDNICYAPIFLDTSWTDHRPEFVVNMTFFKQGSIRSSTWVNRDIPQPICKLKILQKDTNDKESTLYNVTARLCDFHKFTKQIAMINQAFRTVLKQGNYSMSCPLKKGFYVMENVRVANRNPIWGFIYQSKTIFTLLGGLYQEANNNASLVALTTYKVVLKIIKKSCRE